MRIRILSDLHLEFAAFEPTPVKADVVVLAGDTSLGTSGVEWAKRHFRDTPVIYVLGNHEYYHHGLPALSEELKALCRGSNVRVLENDSVVINDVRFLGCTLWTDFMLYGRKAWADACMHASTRMADFSLKKRMILNTGEHEDPRYPTYFMPLDSCEQHAASLKWLKYRLRRKLRPTVVVTHHAPATGSIHPMYRNDALNPAFVSNLDDFVATSSARLWIHGHVHNRFDYTLGNTRVVCNPRGYPGLDDENGFDPELVIDIAT